MTTKGLKIPKLFTTSFMHDHKYRYIERYILKGFNRVCGLESPFVKLSRPPDLDYNKYHTAPPPKNAIFKCLAATSGIPRTYNMRGE